MLRQLGAEVDAAESRGKVEEANLQFAQQRLALIQRQAANCTIRAPVAGTVVYWSPRGGRSDIISEGLRVFERQPILRVEDLTQLQVKAQVDETRVAWIKAGMPAKIVVDALPDRELTGSVASVSDRPESEKLEARGEVLRGDPPPRSAAGRAPRRDVGGSEDPRARSGRRRERRARDEPGPAVGQGVSETGPQRRRAPGCRRSPQRPLGPNQALRRQPRRRHRPERVADGRPGDFEAGRDAPSGRLGGTGRRSATPCHVPSVIRR